MHRNSRWPRRVTWRNESVGRGAFRAPPSGARQWTAPTFAITAVMRSSLTERTNRTAYAFRFGDIGGRRMTLALLSRMSRRNCSEYLLSRSTISLGVQSAACESITLQPGVSTIRQRPRETPKCQRPALRQAFEKVVRPCSDLNCDQPIESRTPTMFISHGGPPSQANVPRRDGLAMPGTQRQGSGGSSCTPPCPDSAGSPQVVASDKWCSWEMSLFVWSPTNAVENRLTSAQIRTYQAIG